MIDLYTSGTPNGWKASVTLEELGLPDETHAIELGKGHSLKDVLAKRLSVTEGVYTAGALVEMAAARGIDMPIAQAVHAVISGLATVDEAIEALLARPLRAEV